MKFTDVQANAVTGALSVYVSVDNLDVAPGSTVMYTFNVNDNSSFDVDDSFPNITKTIVPIEGKYAVGVTITNSSDYVSTFMPLKFTNVVENFVYELSNLAVTFIPGGGGGGGDLEGYTLAETTAPIGISDENGVTVGQVFVPNQTSFMGPHADTYYKAYSGGVGAEFKFTNVVDEPGNNARLTFSAPMPLMPASSYTWNLSIETDLMFDGEPSEGTVINSSSDDVYNLTYTFDAMSNPTGTFSIVISDLADGKSLNIPVISLMAN